MAHVMRQGTVPLVHRHYQPVAEGEHARRQSLFAIFLGVPAAAMLWQLWSVLFQGPGASVQAPRFAGWSAVFVMLPATLLVVGTAVTSLVLAARACAAHVQHAERALFLSGAGLMLVLVVVGTVSADAVSSAPTAAVVRVVMVALAAAATLVAQLWSRAPAR